MSLTPPIASADDPLVRLQRDWGVRPFCQHRLWADVSALALGLPDLEQLLRSLSPEAVFVRVAGQHPGVGVIPRVPLGPEPLAEQLAQRSLHVVALDLHKVDSGYRRVLDQFVELTAPVHRDTDPARLSPTIGIFLASGTSVVPFHADLEHNFLMQIYGHKYLHVFPNSDWNILPATARERMSVNTGEGRFLSYDPEFERRADVFHLLPGMSSYQPPFCPHWVENGSEVSLSVLLSIYTSAELKLRLTHMVNHRLRRFGMQPALVGQHALRDTVKAGAAGFMRAALQTVRRVAS